MQEDIDFALKEDDPFIRDVCCDVKVAFSALNKISYHTNDNEFISDCERKIENVVSKMAREMVYLQVQLSILERKTNTEIRKNTLYGINKQLSEIIVKKMDDLLNDIHTECIMIP